MSTHSTKGFSLTRLGDDPAQLQDMLAGFLRDTADAHHRLLAHVKSDALDQLAARVHFIRGAACYMGATALCEVGHRLELAALRNDRSTSEELLAQFVALLASLRQFLHSHLQPQGD